MYAQQISRLSRNGAQSLCKFQVDQQFKGVIPRQLPHRQIRAFSSDDMAQQVTSNINSDKVVMFSKTYCPYCQQVKSLFSNINVETKVIELDTVQNGGKMQDTLTQLHGQRTVPQVFIGGKLLGGCDDTMMAYSSGSLKTLLQDAGVEIA